MPARAERSRQPPQVLKWGTAKGLSCSQPANARCMHAPRLSSWTRSVAMAARKDGASNRSAGRAERTAREANSCRVDLHLHWEFGRRLPLNYSTHTCRRRSAHLTGRSRPLPSGYQTMRLPHYGSLRSDTGCLWSHRQSHAGIGAQSRMSQSGVWPSDYSVVDTLSRYKQQFTASVKLHTSLARAIWDDLSANVPLQTVWKLP